MFYNLGMAFQQYHVVSCHNSYGMWKQAQDELPRDPRRCPSHRRVKTAHVCQANNGDAVYQPSIWSHDFIKSLKTDFPKNDMDKVKELDKKVKALIDVQAHGSSALSLLELIDEIENLGLGYRFKTNIARALEKVESTIGNYDDHVEEKEQSLHAVSLRFRLLRQHGYDVSQDAFRKFMDPDGGFRGCVNKDAKGVLSLYEASHLAYDGETDLQKAKFFSMEHLMKLKGINNKIFMEHVNHSLDIPLYRRVLRLHAHWYIKAYSKRKDANKDLLQLAALDFNMVQSKHNRELQDMSRWWKKIGLASKLSFTRDRLMECFFWAVGIAFEPQYNTCRVGLTKVNALITSIDDIYDVYGSLDELELFTTAVKRWDINALKSMPVYLQLSFLALYNTINEMGYDILFKKGQNCIPILQKLWGELLEAFLVEAKWTHNNYMPTLEDYLDNAWRSVSGVVILKHAYFLMNQDSKPFAPESLERYHDLVKWSSMIFRLCNDLGTSSDEIKRGKTSNAISCYMKDNGVCEEVAREFVKTKIDEAWRNMIQAQVCCSQDQEDMFIDTGVNLARISHCVYRFGDGHGAPDTRAREQVFVMLIEPLTIKEIEC